MKDNRKIAFMIHDLRDGGAERVTISLANGIASCGISVDIVLVNMKGKESYFSSINDNVRLISLPEDRALTSIRGFKRYLNDSRPDVVISALTHINIAVILARLFARHRPRLIVVEHNQMSKNICHKTGLVRLAYAAAPWMYRHADLVGAVSQGVKIDLADRVGMPLHRIQVLHNPVVTPRLREQSRLDPEHPWMKPNEPPVILAVGRLIPQKNFVMLIEAFVHLRKMRSARLLILGQGPDQASLEKQARATGYGDDIAFTGFVANPFAYMSCAAAFALSSDWEGLPTVLIEAMACGVPVVSTDCPSGPSEILLGGKLAALTPPGDAYTFAQALNIALDQERPNKRLIARAEDFSLKKTVGRYLKAAFPFEEEIRQDLESSDLTLASDAGVGGHST